jgi:hypothetical protein
VTGPAEPHQGGPGGRAPLVAVDGLGDVAQVGADAARLEDAPDLVIEVDCPGQRVGLGLALKHDDGVAELTQQDGEGVPDRAVADDHNLGVGGHAGKPGAGVSPAGTRISIPGEPRP